MAKLVTSSFSLNFCSSETIASLFFSFFLLKFRESVVLVLDLLPLVNNKVVIEALQPRVRMEN